MNKVKSISKKLLYILATVVFLAWIAKWAWINSGSNRWELEIDKGGVQVYSLKSPGHYMTQFKSVIKGKYTLNQLSAMLLLDNDSLENCKKWIPNCIGDEVIERYSEEKQGDTILWTLDMAPFTNREFLIRSYAQQDPVTKVVAIDVLSATNKIPRNDCCFRIVQIHNRWQFTPLDNGEVEIELIQDAKMDGFFPDFLINLGNAEEAFNMFHDQLAGFADKDKYRNANIGFIQERG